MPFRLTNAPATFQVYINSVLGDLVNICVIVYLDNILIYLRLEEEYLKYIKEVLYRLRVGKLYINPKKYAFFTKEVKYLGFLIREKGA